MYGFADPSRKSAAGQYESRKIEVGENRKQNDKVIPCAGSIAHLRGCQLFYICVECARVLVGIYVCGYRDIRMPHELLCNIDGDPCFLEIGAESMAKTVRGEVWGNRVLYDLIPPKFCPQFYVQVPREGVPKALEAFVIVPVPGAGLKYRGIRFPLHAEEMIF